MINLFKYALMMFTYTSPMGDVAGVVKDCRGESVRNIEVCVQEFSGKTQCVRTGRFGEYWIRQLPVGSVGVFVSSDNWSTARYRDIRVRFREITEINFTLTPVPEKEFWCKQ